MSTADMQSHLYTRATNEIIGALETGTIPWRKPWSVYGPPTNAATKERYTGINLWLLHSLSYSSNLYLTHEQLQKGGGHVKSLERGHLVLTGNPGVAGAEINYEVVFNVSQCTGVLAPYLEQRAVHLHPPANACVAMIMSMQRKPDVVTEGGCMCYSVADDLILQPARSTFATLEQYYEQLLHQCIHSTGHPNRLNRPSVNNLAELGGDPYSIEELIAEIGTGYLCGMTQMLNLLPKRSAEYTGSWLEQLRNDKTMFITASYEAQRAVDYLLEGNLIAELYSGLRDL